MSVNIDTIAELKHVFGLNLYEAKLWVSLLSKGIASASELSDNSNVPRSRAYDVLESLEKRGFVSVRLGKPIKYVAIPPAEIVEKIKNEIINEKESKLKATSEIINRESFKTLTKIYEKSDTTSKTHSPTAVRGRNNIYSKISGIISESKSGVIIVSDEKGALRKVYELSEALKQARTNGARIKIVSKISDKSKIKELKERFDVLDKDGGMRFVLADDTLALFTSQGEETKPENDTCIIVKSEYLGNAFNNLF